MATYIKCGKCGATGTWGQKGWLVAYRKNTRHDLIIRCPKHLTKYAFKIASRK